MQSLQRSAAGAELRQQACGSAPLWFRQQARSAGPVTSASNEASTPTLTSFIQITIAGPACPDNWLISEKDWLESPGLPPSQLRQLGDSVAATKIPLPGEVAGPRSIVVHLALLAFLEGDARQWPPAEPPSSAESVVAHSSAPLAVS